jgi:hypothetical protein
MAQYINASPFSTLVYIIGSVSSLSSKVTYVVWFHSGWHSNRSPGLWSGRLVVLGLLSASSTRSIVLV